METTYDLHSTSGVLALTIALGATMTSTPGMLSLIFAPTNWLLLFYRYVRQFIGRLHRSGIKPIVVFDGGHDKSDQKLATVISRMTEQSRNAVACTSVTQVLSCKILQKSAKQSPIGFSPPNFCHRASCKFFLCLAEKCSKRFWRSLVLR